MSRKGDPGNHRRLSQSSRFAATLDGVMWRGFWQEASSHSCASTGALSIASRPCSIAHPSRCAITTRSWARPRASTKLDTQKRPWPLGWIAPVHHQHSSRRPRATLASYLASTRSSAIARASRSAALTADHQAAATAKSWSTGPILDTPLRQLRHRALAWSLIDRLGACRGAAARLVLARARGRLAVRCAVYVSAWCADHGRTFCRFHCCITTPRCVAAGRAALGAGIARSVEPACVVRGAVSRSS